MLAALGGARRLRSIEVTERNPSSSRSHAVCTLVLRRDGGGVAPGVVTVLTFPKGGAYSKVAGYAGAAQTAKLTGLRPFLFPFRYEDYAAERWAAKPKYRRQKLLLRHGLEDGSDAGLAAR